MKIFSIYFLQSLWVSVLFTTSVTAELPVVTVGLIAPLTLGNAKMGEDIQRSVELALERFNAMPSSRNQYRLRVEDGKCGSGNAGITAASKLINVDKVDVLIVGCSGEILQAAPLIEQFKVPTMVVYATHPQVKHLGPHIFRVFADSERDVPIVAKRMMDDGRARIAVISEELAFTLGVRDVLQKELKSRVAIAVDYKEGEQDFRTILLKIKSASPDAIFVNPGSVETLGPLVKQVSELRMKTPLYSFAYPSVPTFLNQYSQYVEGMILIAPPSVDTPLGHELVEKLKVRFGSPPNITFVAAAAYDGAVALLTAIEKAYPINSEVIVCALNEHSAPGVLGNIKFDANGDVDGVHYVLWTIRNGKIVQL